MEVRGWRRGLAQRLDIERTNEFLNNQPCHWERRGTTTHSWACMCMWCHIWLASMLLKKWKWQLDRFTSPRKRTSCYSCHADKLEPILAAAMVEGTRRRRFGHLASAWKVKSKEPYEYPSRHHTPRDDENNHGEGFVFFLSELLSRRPPVLVAVAGSCKQRRSHIHLGEPLWNHRRNSWNGDEKE